MNFAAAKLPITMAPVFVIMCKQAISRDCARDCVCVANMLLKLGAVDSR